MQKSTLSPVIFPEQLKAKIQSFEDKFDGIPADRKAVLNQLADFIERRLKRNEKIELVFICTHNSRRSHISQIWAQAAAAYYGIPNVFSYSGGTEATAFNPRAVKAMQEAGFSITIRKAGDNPEFAVRFADGASPVIAFSKKYDDPFNPNKNFAAIMTCSHADENCPLVVGAAARIALPYNDPKDFDGTPQEAAMYSERVHEIGREILFAFAQVNAMR
jgi:arsenate reductase